MIAKGTALVPLIVDRIKNMPVEKAGHLAGECHGFFFSILTRHNREPMLPNEAGRIIPAVGKKAGVVVNKQAGKHSSAHDRQRSLAPLEKASSPQLGFRRYCDEFGDFLGGGKLFAFLARASNNHTRAVWPAFSGMPERLNGTF